MFGGAEIIRNEIYRCLKYHQRWWRNICYHEICSYKITFLLTILRRDLTDFILKHILIWLSSEKSVRFGFITHEIYSCCPWFYKISGCLAAIFKNFEQKTIKIDFWQFFFTIQVEIDTFCMSFAFQFFLPRSFVPNFSRSNLVTVFLPQSLSKNDAKVNIFPTMGTTARNEMSISCSHYIKTM